MTITLRPECPSDEAAIVEVTRLAFLPHPHSSHTEQFIVNALRHDNALPVSLVAEQAGRVVGHIAFSQVAISDGSGHWYGLGPVSVLPECQGQGIGRALIGRGLDSLRALGAQGCVVLGDPLFYRRFGFSHVPDLMLKDMPQDYFLALPLGPIGSASARGEVIYHPAFSTEG